MRMPMNGGSVPAARPAATSSAGEPRDAHPPRHRAGCRSRPRSRSGSPRPARASACRRRAGRCASASAAIETERRGQRRRVRRVLLQRAQRDRAELLRGVGLEQVRAAVDGVHRLARGESPGNCSATRMFPLSSASRIATSDFSGIEVVTFRGGCWKSAAGRPRARRRRQSARRPSRSGCRPRTSCACCGGRAPALAERLHLLRQRGRGVHHVVAAAGVLGQILGDDLRHAAAFRRLQDEAWTMMPRGRAAAPTSGTPFSRDPVLASVPSLVKITNTGQRSSAFL